MLSGLGLCGGLKLDCKSPARRAVGAQHLDAGQGLGLKPHEAAGIGRGRDVGDTEVSALPAVGRLITHGRAVEKWMTTEAGKNKDRRNWAKRRSEQVAPCGAVPVISPAA